MPERPPAEPCGPAKIGALDMTLPQLLKHWAESWPSKPAFIFRHPNDPDVRTVFTFQELYMLGSRCAALLRSGNVRRGDVVVVLLPNSPERVVVEVALLLLAAFSVTGPCKEADGSDLLAFTRKCKATAVVLDPELHKKEWETLRGACQFFNPRKGISIAVTLPHMYFILRVRRNPHRGEEDFICFLRDVWSEYFVANPGPFPHDPAVVVATAGSNIEPPKLVVHTHRNMVAYSKIIMPMTDSPRPMYFLNHSMGTIRGHIAISLSNPVTRILLDELAAAPKSLAMSIFNAVTKERCPIAVLPVSIVQALAKLYVEPLENDEVNRLMFAGFLGEEASTDSLQAVLTFSNMVAVSYVSTEVLMPAMDVVGTEHDLSRLGAGCPVFPEVMVRITDHDGNDRSAAEGEEPLVGNLLLRTPFIFKYYLHDPETTEASFDKDGHFKTGDMAHLRNGRLFIDMCEKSVIMCRDDSV